MYVNNEGEGNFPQNKNEMELVYMLKYMTKENFVSAVNERRFVVQNPKGNKFEVFMITVQEMPEGFAQHGLARVINPDTKDGLFNQSGGGYNKAFATLEDVAQYVDKHAEAVEGWEDFSCYRFLQSKQNYNTI